MLDSVNNLNEPGWRFSPRDSRLEPQAADSLISAWWDPEQRNKNLPTSDQQNSEIISMCRFKPLKVWDFFHKQQETNAYIVR